MCHIPRRRMDASLLVVPSMPLTDQHSLSTSRSWHEQQWIQDDERLEIECINNDGGHDTSTLWMDMSSSPNKSATSNRLFVAMILAAAVFRVRSI